MAEHQLGWLAKADRVFQRCGTGMKQKDTEHLLAMFGLAFQLGKLAETDAVLALLNERMDWEQLKKPASKHKLIIAADTEEEIAGARAAGFRVTLLSMHDSPVFERLSKALLSSVAEEWLDPGGRVVALYSGFEEGLVDTISLIRLDEHLGRLTARDLRQLGAHVPLDTLKVVVDLAIEIGREGREGKPVGTMFVVGDSRRVLASSQSTGFDPVRGYNRKERSLHDARVREGIKEIAQMDGAFIVASDGTVEAACRRVDASADGLSLSRGLGTRHWAAAAISAKSNAVAVVVSETNGTVRIFQKGQLVLRIEPFHSAMKWKDFKYEPPVAD